MTVNTTGSTLVKACDLALKFPHVSVLPFNLHSFRGHVRADQSCRACPNEHK